MLPRIAVFLIFGVLAAAPAQDGPHGPPWANVDLASTHPLQIGRSVLQVEFAKGPLDLPVDMILEHIHKGADALVAYYGRFPVARARMLVVPVAGKSGVFHGTTWPHRGDFQSFTRIHVGEHTTAADLAEDWMATHELVHEAFPSMDDDQHWMEEGQATYIEPVARVMTGELDAHRIWSDMVRDMPKGEPQAGDEGLDHTHTWGRTYWGGALFCLVADVEIRRATQNRKGLQDALRAVLADGGTIDQDWPLPQALAIGDQRHGNTRSDAHVCGVERQAGAGGPAEAMAGTGHSLRCRRAVEFVADAPLAKVREAITAKRD